MMESFFGEPVVSLRTAVRAIHHLGVVYAALADKRLVLGITTAALVILRTLDRELYYRFVAGRASDAAVADQVAERLGAHARVRHKRELAAFEAWIVACQQERDAGDGGVHDDTADTPLMQRYAEVLAANEAEGGQSPTSRERHAREVLHLLDAIRRDSRYYDGIRFKATVQRIELLSPDLGEQHSDS